MLHFVFEDFQDNALPKFYRKYYDDNISMTWTGGNSVMWKMVDTKPVLCKDDYFILFLDFNPWNVNIGELYRLMVKKIRRFGYHYVIIPIISSEYKYLCSLSNVYLKDKDILNKLLYIKDLSEILTEDIRTYEKYIKFVVKELLSDDAKIDDDSGIEPDYVLKETRGEELYYKWLKYICKYDIFPYIKDKSNVDYSDIYSKIRKIDIDGIIKFQNRRVMECNAWSTNVRNGLRFKLHPIDISWYR